MYCQVIVDIAHEDVDRVFTYRVPEGMELCPGMRVHVPFGRMKRIEGVVVELMDECDLPQSRVREVEDALEDTLPFHLNETAFCCMAPGPEACAVLLQSGIAPTRLAVFNRLAALEGSTSYFDARDDRG